MTKRHFLDLATRLGRMKAPLGDAYPSVLAMLTEFCASHNPRFDAHLFITHADQTAVDAQARDRLDSEPEARDHLRASLSHAIKKVAETWTPNKPSKSGL